MNLCSSLAEVEAEKTYGATWRRQTKGKGELCTDNEETMMSKWEDEAKLRG